MYVRVQNANNADAFPVLQLIIFYFISVSTPWLVYVIFLKKNIVDKICKLIFNVHYRLIADWGNIELSDRSLLEIKVQCIPVFRPIICISFIHVCRLSFNCHETVSSQAHHTFAIKDNTTLIRGCCRNMLFWISVWRKRSTVLYPNPASFWPPIFHKPNCDSIFSWYWVRPKHQ